MTFDRTRLERDVRAGLLAEPRSLPSKYFYDERGSQLFERITHVPEYYPTRAERALLERCAPAIVRISRPSTLIELGAGNADKTRILLDEMLRVMQGIGCYIPVDVSADFLASSATLLRAEYPILQTRPVVADFFAQFDLPRHPPPALHAFLGSTIGNFVPDVAVDLLSSVRGRMTPADFFLLGVDLRKDPATIERAYNDSLGITAQFNRNILNVINDCLGSDFVSSAFDHDAIYNDLDHRIEMRLVANREQTVRIPCIGRFDFAPGEAILTELSYKYDRDLAVDLLARAGLVLQEWFTDETGLVALALASRHP